MTFKLECDIDSKVLCQPDSDHFAIVADGDIMASTPDELERFLAEHQIPSYTRLLLTSRGGILNAGMRMGRIIRAHKLHTVVGALAPNTRMEYSFIGAPTGWEPNYGVYPSYCISACTLAFLGGSQRDMNYDTFFYGESFFIVHQFSVDCRELTKASPPVLQKLCTDSSYAMSEAQISVAEVVSYVQEMGVDTAFLREMAAAAPQSGNRLSMEQMKKYRIVFRQDDEMWSLDNVGGELVLQVKHTREDRTALLRFACRRSDPPVIVTMLGESATYMWPSGPYPYVALAFAVYENDHRVDRGDKDFMVLTPREIVSQPSIASGRVELSFALSPRIFDAMSTSTGFSAIISRSQHSTPPEQRYYVGGFEKIDRDKLSSFVRACY
jgi:hypothetical protein